MQQICVVKYDKNSLDYLGYSMDICGRKFDAFMILEDIHIVYNIGTNLEYSTYENARKIKENINDYIYTPYIEFMV